MSNDVTAGLIGILGAVAGFASVLVTNIVMRRR
jgi:hypothetical protein